MSPSPGIDLLFMVSTTIIRSSLIALDDAVRFGHLISMAERQKSPLRNDRRWKGLTCAGQHAPKTDA